MTDANKHRSFARKHEKLDVWQDSMNLVTAVYRLTAGFPSEEKFGLSSQMRRASVSIPSNIAEGAARNSIQDYKRFLIVARSSLTELETQLQIAARLEMLPKADFYLEECNKVFAKLSALIKSLEKSKT